MDGYEAFGLAYGHVQAAAAAFWAADDLSGESLFLAAECVALEGWFADQGVVPADVDDDEAPVGALVRAAEALESARPMVPLGVWAQLQALRARAVR